MRFNKEEHELKELEKYGFELHQPLHIYAKEGKEIRTIVNCDTYEVEFVDKTTSPYSNVNSNDKRALQDNQNEINNKLFIEEN